VAFPTVLNAIQAAIDQVVMPGLSAVTASAGATGTVSLSGVPMGSFSGRLEILSTGPLGTATARLSLDAGEFYDTTFTVPAPVAPSSSGVYSVPLPQIGPIGDSVLSGLVLTFTAGTFTLGNSYTFTAAAQVAYRLGEEWTESYETIFPRVIWVPDRSSFKGSEDRAQLSALGTNLAYDNVPRALATDEMYFEVRCWGCDFERTQLLRDQVFNGLIRSAAGSYVTDSGSWRGTKKGETGKAGREYTFSFLLKMPVPELQPDFLIAQPPFTEVLTQEIDTGDGNHEIATA
jgi:hypothetical protein